MFVKSRLRSGFIDLHCHIIPGVDDGARDMDTAFAMVKLSYEEGIRTIVATPHYHQGKMLCGEEELKKRFEKFKVWVQELFPELTILYGREVYMTYDAVEILEQSREAFCICGTRYILVEFHTTAEYSYMMNLLRHLIFMGYLPILAHIERYECLCGHVDRIVELRTLNVVIQVNALSVIGQSGRTIQKFIKKLIQERMVDIVATDAHTTERRAPRLRTAACYIEKKFGTGMMERLLIHNPNKIIRGEYLEEW